MSEKIKKDPLVDDEGTKEPEAEQEKAPEQPKVEPTKPAAKKAEAKVEKPAETKPADDKNKLGGADAYMKGIENTKDILAKSPHVNFLIPLADGEKPGAADTVQINGYRLTIKKGELVNVPIQVAKLLAEKYKVNMEAGREKLVDRANDIQDALT
jgi:hypothetical protein